MSRFHPSLLVISLTLFGTGCDVKFGSPSNLMFLWLVPLLIGFQLYVARAKRQSLERFASATMLDKLTAKVSRGKQTLKASLLVFAVLAIITALAHPQYGFSWQEVKRKGVDIVIALDVSDSMLVADAETGGKLTRLERAKREIRDLLQLLQGDRIGLVAFAGTAFVECPLTLDYSAAALFLDNLDTDLIPVKGTAIGTAIRTATGAFDESNETSRAVILITDGEDHVGEVQQATQEAKLANVRVFTIGIGRDSGSPIPAPEGGFRRDRKGELILSKLDETTLQKVAVETGGSYVRSVTGDVDLETIYVKGIREQLEAQDLGSKRKQHFEERFQWLLALALLALMLEPLFHEAKSRRARHES